MTSSKIPSNSVVSPFIDQFVDLYKEDYTSQGKNAHLTYACHISLFIAFTVDILEKVWINFRVSDSSENETKLNLDFPHSVLGDLLNSTLIQKLGRDLYQFHPEVQTLLSDFFAENSTFEYRSEIARFIKDYRNQNLDKIFSSALSKSLDLASDIYLDRSKVAKTLLNSFNTVMENENNLDGIKLSLNYIKNSNPKFSDDSGLKSDDLYNVQKLISGVLDFKENNKEEGLAKLKEIAPYLRKKTKENDHAITTVLDKEIVALLDLDNSMSSHSNKISNLFCILVGNDEYDSPDLPPLTKAFSDVLKLENFVKSNLRYRSIKLLENASKQEIVTAFEKVNQEVVDGDTLLFYFAGYGGKELGKISIYNNYIACRDNLKSNKQEPNRLSNYELAHIFCKYFIKDVSIVSILDCGRNEAYTIQEYKAKRRTVKRILNQRNPEEILYGKEFTDKPYDHKLTSIIVSNEEEDNWETPDGGVFLQRFLEIANNPNVVKNNLGFLNIVSLYNAQNNQDGIQQTMEVVNYQNTSDSSQNNFLTEFYLDGKDLVAGRIANAKIRLDLSGLGLSNIPLGIQKNQNLHYIDLSNNNLESDFENLLGLRINQKFYLSILEKYYDKVDLIDITNNKMSAEHICLTLLTFNKVKYDKEKYTLSELKLFDDLEFLKRHLHEIKKLRPIDLNRILSNIKNLKVTKSLTDCILGKRTMVFSDLESAFKSLINLYSLTPEKELHSFYQSIQLEFPDEIYLKNKIDDYKDIESSLFIDSATSLLTEATNNFNVLLTPKKLLLDAALNDLKKANRLYPDQSEVNKNFGIYWLYKSKENHLTPNISAYHKAIEYFEKGLKYNKNDHKINVWLAITNIHLAIDSNGNKVQERCKNAIKVLSDHSKIITDSYRQRLHLGLAYSTLSEHYKGKEKLLYFQNACQNYDLAFEINPSDFTSPYYHGICLKVYGKKQELQEANELFQQASDKFQIVSNLRPEYQSTYFEWGNCLALIASNSTSKISMSLYEEAFKKYQYALKLNQEDFRTLYNFARHKENYGNIVEDSYTQYNSAIHYQSRLINIAFENPKYEIEIERAIFNSLRMHNKIGDFLGGLSFLKNHDYNFNLSDRILSLRDSFDSLKNTSKSICGVFYKEEFIGSGMVVSEHKVMISSELVNELKNISELTIRFVSDEYKLDGEINYQYESYKLNKKYDHIHGFMIFRVDQGTLSKRIPKLNFIDSKTALKVITLISYHPHNKLISRKTKESELYKDRRLIFVTNSKENILGSLLFNNKELISICTLTEQNVKFKDSNIRGKSVLLSEPLSQYFIPNKNQETSSNKIGVKSLDKIHQIEVNNIVYCKAEDNGVRFYLRENKSIWSTIEFKALFNLLPKLHFAQVFRGTIINMTHLEWINDSTLKMSNGDELKIGRTYKKNLLIKKESFSDKSLPLKNQLTLSDKLEIKGTNKNHIISLSDLLYCKAENNGTRFYLLDNKSIWSYTKLKDLTNQLPQSYFIKIFRSTIINISHLNLVDRSTLKMSNGEELKIGRTYKSGLLELLKIEPSENKTRVNKWLLVVGSSNVQEYSRSTEMQDASRILAESLFKHKVGLLSCGWSGVDENLIDRFIDVIKNNKENPHDYIQIMSYPSSPKTFDWLPQIKIDGKDFEMRTVQMVDMSDGVVLIGGQDLVLRTAEFAEERNKPVFPIPRTGGAALRYLNSIEELTVGPLESIEENVSSILKQLLSKAKPIRLFISYARKDSAYIDNLKSFLAPLVRGHTISILEDYKLPINDYHNTVKQTIEGCDIVFSMLSPNFNSSAFTDIETQIAFELFKEGKIKIVPINLKPNQLRHIEFSKIQHLPIIGMPISQWDNQDEAWKSVVADLLKFINKDTIQEALDLIAENRIKESIEFLLGSNIEFQEGDKELIIIIKVKAIKILRKLQTDRITKNQAELENHKLIKNLKHLINRYTFKPTNRKGN